MNSDKADQPYNPYQEALFKAAKVGNIKLVREFMQAGGNLFMPDDGGRNALSYAFAANCEETTKLLEELFPVTLETEEEK